MKCRYCGKSCIKKGQRNKIQRYQCKGCRKIQQKEYIKAPILPEKYEWVHNLNNEGNSLSGIGRLLQISVSSVQRIIERLVSRLSQPINEEAMQKK